MEAEIRYRRTKEYDREDNNKKELEKKISSANDMLFDLEYKSKLMSMTNETTNDKKKKGGEQDLNIEGMIDKLRNEIILVYQESKGQETKGDKDQAKAKAVDVQTKGSLDMLMEIELICDQQMRQIKIYEGLNKKAVQVLEKEAKLARAKENREKITE